jgi:drug/metabolite transporter (DMT)-like permease
LRGQFYVMNPKLSLAIGIICISFSPIFVKLVPLSALSVAFYRLAFAWAALAPYCIFKRNLHIGRKNFIIAVIGGLVFGMDIAVWNISILKSTATISTLIANLAPLWVGLLTLLIFKKQPGISFWPGTFIAICGMVILVGISNILSLQLTEGVVYALGSSVLYAVYILITKDVLKWIDTLSFMFYSMLAATVFLGWVCFFNHDVMSGYTNQTWLLLIVLGLVCQLLGWITINYSIHHLDPTQVSLTLLSQTVATALLAWLLLKETIGFTEILGGIIVLIGIGLTFIKPRYKLHQ